MKRIILAISVLLVLGLSVAAIAYNTNNVVDAAAASCCGDSCPMKKDAAGKDTASCCDEDCCKGDSCPMKTAAGAAAHHPDSCPMKGKDGQASHESMTAAEHDAMKADGKSCCSCCGAKQDS